MLKTRIDFQEEIAYLLKHELKNIQIIKEGSISIEFYVNYLKYKKSKQSVKQCLLEKQNYEINCFIPLKINFEEKNLKCEIIKNITKINQKNKIKKKLIFKVFK